MNERLYLRDPERSALGQRLLRESVSLLDELGFEEFTFRKLAERSETTEASVYRYFENKHRLLLYLMDWYWQWLEYRLDYVTHNLTDPAEKLERLLVLLLTPDQGLSPEAHREQISRLQRVVVQEASKAYLTRHISEDNSHQFFKPYKDLCARIARLLLEYRPDYPYASSRASSLVETAHYQSFFLKNLPSLTSFGQQPEALRGYLRHVLFSSLNDPTL